MLRLVTALGDAAFLVPASIVLLAYLLLRRSPRTALAWLSALALCAGLTVFAKIAFYACGDQLTSLVVRSPSGHTSFGTTFYGCGAIIFSAHRNRLVRLALLMGSGAIVLGIAASRVLLHAHTPQEVLIGLLIGLFCLAWFTFRYLHDHLPRLPLLPAALVVLALVAASYGHHLSIEGRIAQLARELPLLSDVCRLPEAAATSSPGSS
jgi:membrane-associated phospholipid phosphatase